MISPFFGLSVVIHVAVIIWHKITHFLFPNRKKRRIIREHAITHFFGLASIFAVLTFVVFTGITILYASIVEEHSSVYFVESAIPQITQFNYSGTYAKTVSAVPSVETAFSNLGSLNAFEILFLISIVSLVLVLVQGDAIASTFASLQRRVALRKFFVGMGIIVLFVGTASFFVYMFSADSVAAYFTEPGFGKIFGK